jgi:general secretion pathway protein C
MSTVPASDPLAIRLAATLATAIAVIVAAWLTSYWVLYAYTATLPDPPVPTQTKAITVDAPKIARAFGDTGPAAPPTHSIPPAAALNLRLKGVVAATGRRPASAIVNSGGRDQVVLIGQEIQPGLKLAKVHPDRIEIERGGVLETLPLDVVRTAGPRGATPGAGAATLPGAGVARPTFPLDVAANGNQFTFSRKRLDESLKSPAAMAATGRIGVAPGGGARVDDAPAGSLAQRLGFQAGDIIRSVNGQPIASPGDLARLYQQFATLNRIEAEVQRGAGTVRLQYAVSP